MQYSHWGYPEEFCPTPLGFFANHHANMQIAKGQAARFVLYRYDFRPPGDADQDQLKPRGLYELNKLTRLATFGMTPLVIEATGDFQLDEARRVQVVTQLAQMGMIVDETQVIVGRPVISQMMGDEWVSVIENLREQTKNQGASLDEEEVNISILGNQ